MERKKILSAEDFKRLIEDSYLNGTSTALSCVEGAMAMLESGVEKEELTLEEAWNTLKGTVRKTKTKIFDACITTQEEAEDELTSIARAADRNNN